MAVKFKTVQDVLLFEYAQLIADAAVYGRADQSPVVRRGDKYWGFVTTAYRKLSAGDISPSTILRENKLLVANGMECAYCGVTEKLQWEHIIPRSRRGPDTIDNLALSCSKCNGQKAALNPVEWYQARGLKRKAIPRLVMGKLIKLVIEEHKRCGTLGLAEFPSGLGLTVVGACLIFDRSGEVVLIPN